MALSEDAHNLCSQLLLLSVLLHVLPPAPRPPTANNVMTSLDLDDSMTDSLLDLISFLYASHQIHAIHPSRASEDSSRASYSHLANKPLFRPSSSRHQHVASTSRSGPFSPASSSSSLPQLEALHVNSPSPSPYPPSVLASQPSAQQPSSSWTIDVEIKIQEQAAQVLKVLSYYCWDRVWSRIRNKIRRLASETTDVEQLSDVIIIGACYADRPKVVQVMQGELSDLIYFHDKKYLADVFLDG